MVEPLTIDVDEQRVFRNYLAKVIASVDDLSFSMGEAARIIKQDSIANFILKGFGKYAPLNPSYLRRKRILAPGASILVGANPGSVIGGFLKAGGGISGRLRDSIVGTTPDSVLRITKKSLEVGTKAKTKRGAPYPVFVQRGTQKMASRPFLFLTKKMVKRIINTIDDQIITIWKTGRNVKT